MSNPNPIIQEAIERAGNPEKYRLVVMFSGGKDSLTVAHYCAFTLGLNIELVYLNTGIGTTENRDYVLGVAKKYNWKLTEIHPLPHETYEIYVKRFGFPRQGMHGAVMGYLKYHPLRKWNREQKKIKGDNIILISGRRKAESKRRSNRKTYSKTVNIVDGMLICAPLWNWTDSQVWQYLHDNNIDKNSDLCPVYKTLHMSGDCLCGAFSRQDESRLISIFHKDLSDKIKALEDKYGGSWGRGISITEAIKQGRLDKFFCSECYYEQMEITVTTK